MIRMDRNKHSFYEKMYRAAKQDECSGFIKALFNGIRAVDTLPYENKYTKEQLEIGVKLSDEVMDLLKKATPKEIMTLFPIEKEYDGAKWGQKDYFYTAAYLKSLDSDRPLGVNVEDFVWHYYNWDIMNFHIIYDSYHSELRQLEYEAASQQLQEQARPILNEVDSLCDLLDEGLSRIENKNEQITQLENRLKTASLIKRIILKIKLKKMIDDRDSDYITCKFLDACKCDYLKQYAQLEAWDDYIEILAKIDKDQANETIILRNKTLNKCY